MCNVQVEALGWWYVLINQHINQHVSGILFKLGRAGGQVVGVLARIRVLLRLRKAEDSGTKAMITTQPFIRLGAPAVQKLVDAHKHDSCYSCGCLGSSAVVIPYAVQGYAPTCSGRNTLQTQTAMGAAVRAAVEWPMHVDMSCMMRSISTLWHH